MMSTIAIACNSTRACINLLDVLPLPPYAMFTRPRIKTITTRPMTNRVKPVKKLDIELFLAILLQPSRPMMR